MIITYCINNNIVEGYDQTQDCIGTYHEQYDPCSETCGGGTQNLKFSVDIDPVSGYFRGNQKQPVPCRLERTRQCNTHNCPIDCKYVGGGEGWGNWIKNLDSNGKEIGSETRTRQIRINDKYGGDPCGEVTQTRKYNVNCGYSGWSSWGACSNTCGGGTQRRTRSILQQPKNGGNPCGELEQTKSCNIQPCPIDCVLSDWKRKSYNKCSKTCGGGRIKEYNDIRTYQKYEGQSCGARERYVSCNTQPCPPPIDCVGKWEWTGGCNTSIRKQKYKITTNSAHKGKKCPFKEGTTKWVANACYRTCARSGRCGWPHNRYNCCKQAGGWAPR